MKAVSPLAPRAFPDLPEINGVRLATAAAGIRYAGRPDVLLAAFDKGTTVAGVFTRSKCPSAPVEWCRDRLGAGKVRALVVNSGNATKLTADLAAQALGCRPSEVFLASTGVIGEPLEAQRFAGVMEGLASAARPDAWHEAAGAIMTTDTFPKGATATARLGETEVTVNGIAKGAGMIAPDMATLLAFVFTDAPVAAPVLQALVSRSVVDTFNAVTVDGDTSTSDTLLVFATGTAAQRGAPRIERANDRRLGELRQAFATVLGGLAEQVARDGEGARKLIEVVVDGATSKRSARRIALSIANSPLVKTAVGGEDANWGRVVMAVGKAGEPADRDRLSIWFGDIRVAHRGARDPDYSEDAVSAYMRRPEITVRVGLGLGTGSDRVLTCDLTKEYIAINGDYRS
jgi:glutamate N-acetyltransferase/amino-acid N-acetyltransferase